MKIKILTPILFIIVVVIAFEIFLRSTGVVNFIFPRPSIIFQELIKNWVWIWDNLKVTLYEAVTGFGISILLGVALALICLFAPFSRSTIVPVTIAIRNVPFVAIAPILFMVFGYGPLAKIVIVVLFR
jgi:NitT/TauT family transport system permease protein